MTPPSRERLPDRDTTPREPRGRPAPRTDSPPPVRTEGIVQAILTWLDGQL